MPISPRFRQLGLIATTCLLLEACAQLPGQTRSVSTPRANATLRTLDGERWVTLDNFDTTERRYDYLGPVQHPFFNPVAFTTVRSTMTGSAVQEILGTASNKPHKGMLVAELDAEDASFERGPENKRQLAKQAFVSFKWGVNGAASVDPSLFLSVVFVAATRSGNRAIAYAWSNQLCPGTVLKGNLTLYDGAVPLRTVVLNKSLGLNQPCGEAALQRIKPETVKRNLAADFRWAYDSKTPAAGDGDILDDVITVCPTPPVQMTPNWPCPLQFVQDVAGTPLTNTELLGIAALGFGAEIAKGVCAHSILDDLAYQLNWKE